MQTYRRNALPFLLAILVFSSMHLNDVSAYPTDILEDEDDGEDGEAIGVSWSLSELSQGNELDDHRRQEALQKLQKIFGIRRQGGKSTHHKTPPQFMMELYNTIADSSGVTRGRNPYNAKVVRSFIERDTSLSHFYFFNISGLETNESVLEAELHLYRKKMPIKTLHLSTLTSPSYLIRVYQVSDGRSLAIPDLHKLLDVRYVGTHVSGWQVFNVTQAVLSWVGGEPNLGLLVTATTLFEEKVSIEFSRRNEYHRSKQPILVLFDDDGKEQRAGTKIAPRYYAYDNEEEKNTRGYEDGELEDEYEEDDEQQSQQRHRRRKRQKGELEWTLPMENREDEFFERQKRMRAARDEEEDSKISLNVEKNARKKDQFAFDALTGSRQRRDAKSRRKVSRTSGNLAHVLTSMDIYERAMLREKLRETSSERKQTIGKSRRDRRSAKKQQNHASQANTTECTRHELYVDFKEIGLSSSIIAPKGYSAYHCKGLCESPLSQDQQPTNHATVQGIVHKMGLVKGVERPCCVPIKLLSTPILFSDDNENFVLKMYEDMIADRCGCR